MSVHKKLMQARIELQNTKLQKTGNNKFAGYSYFELGDFLPQVQAIFNTIGLCGIVSFGEELATLTITDIETDKEILITSPMKEANLKGCHPIQNLGAVETYTRRYLWVAAMEIVEHDALDSSKPLDEEKKEVFNLKHYSSMLENSLTVEELQANYLDAKAQAVKCSDSSAMKAINAKTTQLKAKLESIK